MTETHPLGLVVFAITYVLISSRSLSWLGFDRPAGALLGAVACVVLGVLTPEAALGAIDGATLLLLFGVMGMGAFLHLDGFFEQIETRVVTIARTPARLLGLVVWGSGALSALITNDAVCLLGAPLVVRLIQKHDLPRLPFLLALATAANTGSAATLVGNPQNMLCGMLGDLSYRGHLLLVGPVALVGLVLNHALLWFSFRRELADSRLVAAEPVLALERPVQLTLAVIALTTVVYGLGADLAWTATAGFVLLMLLHRRDARQLWPRIDWALLLFFSGLFVVVAGLMKSGAPQALFERFPLAGAANGLWENTRLASIFLVGSNLVSNVPFILVVKEQMASLPDARLGWEMLAMASTFAGNLTLVGSVANIIVAEAGRDVGGIGFFEYLRVGLPLALATTAIGVVWLSLI
jgi:Na+/H+ antiporter NhaD/arsenite permease-like protein